MLLPVDKKEQVEEEEQAAFPSTSNPPPAPTASSSRANHHSSRSHRSHHSLRRPSTSESDTSEGTSAGTITPASPGATRSGRGNQGRRAEDAEFVRERDERSPLLPPPYAQAVRSNQKKKKRRWKLYICLGFAVLLLLLGAIGAWLDGDAEMRRKTGAWRRGGRDGKGGWDERWNHRFTLDKVEAFNIRNCDLFEVPRQVPMWQLPSTSPSLYQSTQVFRFKADEVHDLEVRGRGSRMWGDMIVEAPVAGIWQDYDPDEGMIEVRLLPSFTDTGSMKDWHACQFGPGRTGGFGQGKDGVVILGLEDDGEPVMNTWREGYLKWKMYVLLPTVARVDVKRGRLGAGNETVEEVRVEQKEGRKGEGKMDFTLRFHNIGVVMNGDYHEEFFRDVMVKTENAMITIGDLSARSFKAYQFKAPILIDRIRTSTNSPIENGIAIRNDKDQIFCAECNSQSFIAIDSSLGKVRGSFIAKYTVDVATSGAPVEGYFESMRTWIKTSSGRVEGVFRGLKAVGGEGGLLVLNANGDIRANISTSETDNEHIPIRMQTNVGSVEVVLEDMPIEAAIQLDLEANYGTVKLDAVNQFAGTFEADTSVGAHIAIEVAEPEDSSYWKYFETDRVADDEFGWKNRVRGNLTYHGEVVRAASTLAIATNMAPVRIRL